MVHCSKWEHFRCHWLVLLVMMHFVLCLSVVGRPAARSASWPAWTRWTVFRCFWLLFHTFSCEGGPRILRLILRQTHGFSLSPSYSAVTCSVSWPWKVFRKLWIYWEMTSGIFRFPGMLRSTVLTLLRQSTELACMLLRSARTCGFSKFSAYWLDSGHIYGVSLRVCSHMARRHYFYSPLYLASSCFDSSPEKSTRRGFSGRLFQTCSRFLRCLARQWIHIWRQLGASCAVLALRMALVKGRG